MVEHTAHPALRGSSPQVPVLGEHELAALFPAVRHRTYSRKASIVRAGDGAKGLYVLLAGRAKMVMEDPHGRQVTLSTLAAGEFLPTSIWTALPRPT